MSDAADGRRRRRFLRARVLVPLGAVLVGLSVVALALFQPWKLWVDDVVNEAFPVATATAAAPTPEPQASEAAPARSPSPTPAGPTVLATGRFISHEHATRGTARVVRLEDGSRVLRIDDLETSNGPDLRVWLAAAPVEEGRAGWYVFDDDDHVELGRLKGNIGDQNYVVPASVDLDELSSVSIWCDRFNVSFGAAALR